MPEDYNQYLEWLSHDLNTLEALYPDMMKPLFDKLQGVVHTTLEAHCKAQQRNHQYVQPSLLDHISEDRDT